MVTVEPFKETLDDHTIGYYGLSCALDFDIGFDSLFIQCIIAFTIKLQYKLEKGM